MLSKSKLKPSPLSSLFSELRRIDYSLSKWRFLCSLNRSPNYIFFWIQNGYNNLNTQVKSLSYTCFFGIWFWSHTKPHYHSNIGVWLRYITELGTSTSKVTFWSCADKVWFSTRGGWTLPFRTDASTSLPIHVMNWWFVISPRTPTCLERGHWEEFVRTMRFCVKSHPVC